MEVFITGQNSNEFSVLKDSELPDLTKLQEGIISKRKILQFVENLRTLHANLQLMKYLISCEYRDQ